MIFSKLNRSVNVTCPMRNACTFFYFWVWCFGLLGLPYGRGETVVIGGNATPMLARTAETDHWLEQRNASLQPTDKHNVSTRDFFNVLLEIAARGGDMKMAEGLLELAGQKHEPDPTSKLHGNYAWYWKDAHPDDRNAVEFCMQTGSLAWMLYRDQLSEKARTRLEEEIRYSITGIRRHQVPVSYTNIFLMKAANCIFIGENLPDESLAKEGYVMFDQWYEYTLKNGIHEYSSPTYYAVDLGSLGLLAKYPKNTGVRAKAEKVLRFFWTELAANWFEPYQGIAGSHSRDYDFLYGHGILDRYFEKAGWLKPVKPFSPDALVELSAWVPPPEIRAAVSSSPRFVFQRWGEKPWECSAHYVGRHCTLGSAGAGYNAQDKTLTVNLPLGPQAPVVNFAMDERGDPYGQAKVLTGGGHMKLTHLVPFMTSVQNGSSALLLACQNPQKKPSAFAKSIVSNIVFPSAAEVWLTDGPVKFAEGATKHELLAGCTVFLRVGDVAVAMRYVLALDTGGKPAPVALVRDGGKVPAMRFAAIHSVEASNERAVVAVWIRVAEGLNDEAFKKFRQKCAKAKTPVKMNGDVVEISAPSENGKLRLVADLKQEKRLKREGSGVKNEQGIFSVNDTDLGAELLK